MLITICNIHCILYKLTLLYIKARRIRQQKGQLKATNHNLTITHEMSFIYE